MKRAVLSAVFIAAAAALGGCPIYSHEDDGCWRDRDCENGYLCDDSSGTCYLPGSESGRCFRPSDCGMNQTCSSAGVCVSGDCSFSGCVSGYRCDVSTGTWRCLLNSDGTGNAGASGAGASGAGASGAGASDAGTSGAGAGGLTQSAGAAGADDTVGSAGAGG